MAGITITDQHFQHLVLESQIPVVVDFWATWCPPCKIIEPLLDGLAKEYEGKVVIGKVNADENPEAVEQLNIMSLPTVVVFKGGQPVKVMVGAQAQQVYKQAIEEALTA